MSITSEQESTLIQRAIVGDCRAFDALIKPHLGNISRQIQSFFRNPCDADDALQDALIAINAGLASFRGDSKFSVWCYAVAANAARAIYNKNKRASRTIVLQSDYTDPKADDDDSLPDYAGTGAWQYSPEDELCAKQLAGKLDSAFASLTDEQRDAIYLREIEQLSYEEIAARLGCPVGSVKSRLHRARQVVEAAM